MKTPSSKDHRTVLHRNLRRTPIMKISVVAQKTLTNHFVLGTLVDGQKRENIDRSEVRVKIEQRSCPRADNGGKGESEPESSGRNTGARAKYITISKLSSRFFSAPPVPLPTGGCSVTYTTTENRRLRAPRQRSLARCRSDSSPFSAPERYTVPIVRRQADGQPVARIKKKIP